MGREEVDAEENNKLLRLWAPDYNGFKWGASMWPTAPGTSRVGAITRPTDIAVVGAPCSPNAFIDGYLLGWSNSGFTADTNIYIDDVAIWDVP